MGGIRTRTREITNITCLKGFTGRESIDSVVLQAAQVSYAGVDEQQTVTITGTPTGGTFTLTYAGSTTAGIAFNATAAAVEDALEALPSIGSGNVRVTGGPGPGTPYVVTFQRDLGRQNIAPMTASATGLTGGTPAIAVTTTTPGDSTDANRLALPCGAILTIVPGTAAPNAKYREFTAQGGEAIEGILGKDVEFVDRTSASDKDAPLLVFGARFDKTKIRNYNTHQAALATWAAAHASRFD